MAAITPKDWQREIARYENQKKQNLAQAYMDLANANQETMLWYKTTTASSTASTMKRPKYRDCSINCCPKCKTNSYTIVYDDYQVEELTENDMTILRMTGRAPLRFFEVVSLCSECNKKDKDPMPLTPVPNEQFYFSK